MNILVDKLKEITKQDKVEVGIGGFLFYARVSDSLELSSDSPDLYLENGSIVQDNIIVNPIKLSIEAVIGEVNLKSSPIDDVLKKINANLGNFNDFLPKRTQAQIQKINGLVASAQNKLQQINRYVNAGNQVANVLGHGLLNRNESSHKKDFLDYIEKVYYNKVLIDIKMPYRSYSNMHITSITLATDNKADAYNIKIEAKQIRFIDDLYGDTNQFFKNPSVAMGKQTDGNVNKGIQRGKPVESSLLSSTIDLLKR